MRFSLPEKSATLSVGEFASFAIGPREGGPGAAGPWRALLGQHWHNELRERTRQEFAEARFEVVIDETVTHRGWRLSLTGRIDQSLPAIAGKSACLREIKTVTRDLPAPEEELRAGHPSYFRQLATYLVLSRVRGEKVRGELVFVEASSGLAQTVALTPFDEALVHHQLDALVEFLESRRRAGEQRRQLEYVAPFSELRPGQESVAADLDAAFAEARHVFFEAPTGFGKTGCALEFALGRLKSGRFARVIWLTGKSTGQLQVIRTLETMTAHASSPLPVWQVRNKAEHCVNEVFHCVSEACRYLSGCADRWPGSGLARFHRDPRQPHDLPALREAGRTAVICPYEITRTALAYHDVWIGDYNYVFAPGNRGLFFEQPGFDPAETLLVIDEAHNLPSRVADAHSHVATVAGARELAAALENERAPSALQLAVDAWARLLGRLRPAPSLDPETEEAVADAIEHLVELTTSQPLDYAALGPEASRLLWQFPALQEFLDDEALVKLLWVAREGELSFTCIDASAVIGAMLGSFGGALLMSATLSPFENTAASCGLASASDATGAEMIRAWSARRAPAVWRDRAYDVAVDVRVDTTLRNRASHYATTAATIEKLRAASPTAVTVFFPSYAYADAVQRSLEESGSVLRVALQPKLPDLAAQAAWVEESLALSDALFLVLGSSFAEGIDLLGGRVTHAMVVGPALPEVNAVQKARQAAFADLGRNEAFRRVYQIPGLQKVNQALGRLVRAPGQHAKILLHCRRFAEPDYASLLAPEYQMYREIVDDVGLEEWLKEGRSAN
ncbi:MAG TPA: helicase C-terminal domain-containing protein [Candidatus Didemnitutus sp.]|nr:helicase C-terminal domain-containing protein [Candidatus Didemnitutus sp.]